MVWMKTLIFQENLNLPSQEDEGQRSVGTEGPEKEKCLQTTTRE